MLLTLLHIIHKSHTLLKSSVYSMLMFTKIGQWFSYDICTGNRETLLQISISEYRRKSMLMFSTTTTNSGITWTTITGMKFTTLLLFSPTPMSPINNKDFISHIVIDLILTCILWSSLTFFAILELFLSELIRNLKLMYHSRSSFCSQKIGGNLI